MSDIYDYAYGHVLHRPAEVSNNKISCEVSTYILPDSEGDYIHVDFAKSSHHTYSVDTDNFSPRDLQIFVDSLEVIARLEKAKNSDKFKKRAKKSTKPKGKIQITCLDSSTCDSHDGDEADNSTSDLSWLASLDYLYGQAYSELPNQGQSTALYSNLLPIVAHDISDSEDSGIFVNNISTHLYQNIEPLKPKSKIVSYSKSKSLRHRFIRLLSKRRHVKHYRHTVDIFSSTAIVDEEPKKYPLELQQSKQEKNKSCRGKKHGGNIFAKAIRLLTL